MNHRPVAIVTAASRGIGAGCARELAGRGYAVSLMARSPEVKPFASDLGGIGIVGDVRHEADLSTLVEQTLDAYGRIDVVVNNTGAAATGELLSVTDEEWHDGLDLLFLNVVRVARLVTPVMERQGGGAVVNISAFGAIQPGIAFPVSSAIRAALSAFTKVYADRYARENIRMNNVLPGYVDTFDVTDALRADIPMGREAKVEEVAHVVAFLLSPEASYLTGQNIRVDGGMSRMI